MIISLRRGPPEIRLGPSFASDLGGVMHIAQQIALNIDKLKPFFAQLESFGAQAQPSGLTPADAEALRAAQILCRLTDALARNISAGGSYQAWEAAMAALQADPLASSQSGGPEGAPHRGAAENPAEMMRMKIIADMCNQQTGTYRLKAHVQESRIETLEAEVTALRAELRQVHADLVTARDCLVTP